jgi:hypothetical protein
VSALGHIGADQIGESSDRDVRQPSRLPNEKSLRI